MAKGDDSMTIIKNNAVMVNYRGKENVFYPHEAKNGEGQILRIKQRRKNRFTKPKNVFQDWESSAMPFDLTGVVVSNTMYLAWVSYSYTGGRYPNLYFSYSFDGIVWNEDNLGGCDEPKFIMNEDTNQVFFHYSDITSSGGREQISFIVEGKER
jgi:hypothetical protein